MLVVPKTAEHAALFIGMLTCALVVLLNYTHIGAVLAHGGEQTRAFEPLAVGAAAFVLACAPSGDFSRTRALALAGRYLLATSMIAFGLHHYMYAAYIAALIPPWFLARQAFTYITGTGFIAAGNAIGSHVQTKLGARLLELMFLVFVTVVQAQLVVMKPANGDLWASLFVPATLCRCAWVVASAPDSRPRAAPSG
jgi:uncharacterized membrane protein